MSEPDPQRRELLRQGLADLGCQALLVLARGAADPDAAPFVGRVHLGGCFVVARPQEEPRLGYLTPMERGEAAGTGLALLEPEELEVTRLARERPTPEAFLAAVVLRGLELAGLSPGRLALAGEGPVGTVLGVTRALEDAGWTPVPGNHLARMLRKTKDARQLRAARKAAAGTATALRRVAELLAAAEQRDGAGELWLAGERLTVARLRLEVAGALVPFGLEQPEGNIIAPGEEAALPHNTGTPDRVLRAGEPLVVDLFPRGWIYADCTRTFCVGPPPEALAAAYAVVLEALERGTARLEPGSRGSSHQESVCAAFGARGYPTPISDPGTTVGYVHSLGHGVGFELHEYPSFRRQAGEEGVLAVGDLLTVEPGLYDPGAGWGVRLEDLVYLGEAGPENLTPLPYDLDPRAWA